MTEKELHKQLVERYINGEASLPEVEAFFHLLNQGLLDEYLQKATMGEGPLDLAAGEIARPAERTGTPPGKLRRLGRLTTAAAVILLLGLGIFRWLRPQEQRTPPVASNIFKNEVSPGSDKALLTLADGTSIVLDSAEKGNLASQGKTHIVKVDAGQLSYKTDPANKTAGPNGSAAIYYNTVSTPSGGQYQVTLADGTKVWMNALSSLRFPTAFHDSVRTVELTGEAYFEVAPLTARGGHGKIPFTVNIPHPSGGGKDMQVQVLGTHFNINAYGDESSVKTTLLEGAVKLVKGNSSIQLHPGEQGQTPDPAAGSSSFILVKDAAIDQVMAWKNGLFSFEGADIYTVMRQISRWYGVQIRYEGSPGNTLFGGEIQRDLNLTQVLNGLSKTRVHFRLEGRTVTVLP